MRSYAKQAHPARNLLGISVVAALHAALIWALVNGLGHRMIDFVRPPPQLTIIPTTKPMIDLPPPAPPQVANPQPMSFPEPVVITNQPSSPGAITVPLMPAGPITPPAMPPAAPVIPDSNVSPSALTGELPAYPDDMLTEQVTGGATVRCDVEADGSTSHCAIVKVNGSSEFGSTVLAFVRSHRLHPATHNGVAVRTVGALIPYKFTLSD